MGFRHVELLAEHGFIGGAGVSQQQVGEREARGGGFHGHRVEVALGEGAGGDFGGGELPGGEVAVHFLLELGESFGERVAVGGVGGDAAAQVVQDDAHLAVVVGEGGDEVGARPVAVRLRDGFADGDADAGDLQGGKEVFEAALPGGGHARDSRFEQQAGQVALQGGGGRGIGHLDHGEAVAAGEYGGGRLAAVRLAEDQDAHWDGSLDVGLPHGLAEGVAELFEAHEGDAAGAVAGDGTDFEGPGTELDPVVVGAGQRGEAAQDQEAEHQPVLSRRGA